MNDIVKNNKYEFNIYSMIFGIIAIVQNYNEWNKFNSLPQTNSFIESFFVKFIVDMIKPISTMALVNYSILILIICSVFIISDLNKLSLLFFTILINLNGISSIFDIYISVKEQQFNMIFYTALFVLLPLTSFIIYRLLKLKIWDMRYYFFRIMPYSVIIYFPLLIFICIISLLMIGVTQ